MVRRSDSGDMDNNECSGRFLTVFGFALLFL